MAQNDNLVYLNGEYLPLTEAKVSVLDRGFLFGDGVYEVIPVYGGRPFRLDEHLRRLDNSLRGIRMTNPLSDDRWAEIFGRLITGTHDQYLYLQVTRGAAPKRDHAIPDEVNPTVFVMCSPIAPIPIHGVRAITLDDIRWQWCHIKAITLLANVLLRQEAVDRGAAEAILVRDGWVTEGAASNVFAVIDGVLITPPKGNDLLPGITRDLVLELALENDVSAAERHIRIDELKGAAEIWLTSSTREILPVIELDGIPVGNGRPGPLWSQMQAVYQAYKQRLRTA
ncbi:D-amino acid aminotransferase [Methylocaldum szegediense]|jgi:D-alanine transaminase|uniref:D-alanine aminotransferase n=1 Tax=Methylocaldum szegediense TaxID=73780 RepID=A0ABN8X4B0_9GAMM|nr:D-amino acid aminotransferase [Methylocaldum szegediense]CAI8867158.1 D-alanine aminotransferase [Methylocaldum szegediense]